MKKVLTIFGIMLIILFTLTINVYAYTYSVKLEPAKTSLQAGDTVTVDIMINSILLESGETGIIGLEADLEYDTTVFSKASVSGEGSWTEGENITKVKGIFFTNEVKQTGKLATITLTVADSAKQGETAVTLKNIKTANGSSGEVSTSDASVKLEIVVDSNNDNDDTNNDTSNNGNDNDGNTNNDTNNNI